MTRSVFLKKIPVAGVKKTGGRRLGQPQAPVGGDRGCDHSRVVESGQRGWVPPWSAAQKAA